MVDRYKKPARRRGSSLPGEAGKEGRQLRFPSPTLPTNGEGGNVGPAWRGFSCYSSKSGSFLATPLSLRVTYIGMPLSSYSG